jgi:hypothetical protein
MEGNNRWKYTKPFDIYFTTLFIDFLPLLINIFAVINQRMSTIAINPMDSRGHAFVEQRQRIL